MDKWYSMLEFRQNKGYGVKGDVPFAQQKYTLFSYAISVLFIGLSRGFSSIFCCANCAVLN